MEECGEIAKNYAMSGDLRLKQRGNSRAHCPTRPRKVPVMNRVTIYEIWLFFFLQCVVISVSAYVRTYKTLVKLNPTGCTAAAFPFRQPQKPLLFFTRLPFNGCASWRGPTARIRSQCNRVPKVEMWRKWERDYRCIGTIVKSNWIRGSFKIVITPAQVDVDRETSA